LLFLYDFKDDGNIIDTLKSILEKISEEYPMFRFKACISERLEQLEYISESII